MTQQQRLQFIMNQMHTIFLIERMIRLRNYIGFILLALSLS